MHKQVIYKKEVATVTLPNTHTENKRAKSERLFADLRVLFFIFYHKLFSGFWLDFEFGLRLMLRLGLGLGLGLG